MTYQVLVREAAPGGYTAQVLALPTVEVSAPTHAEAVAQARAAIAEVLQEGQIVEVDVTTHPWAGLAGLYEGDEQFQEALQAISAHRAATTADELPQWDTAQPPADDGSTP